MTTQNAHKAIAALSLSVALVVTGIATMVFGSAWVGGATVAAGLLAIAAGTRRPRSRAR